MCKDLRVLVCVCVTLLCKEEGEVEEEEDMAEGEEKEEEARKEEETKGEGRRYFLRTGPWAQHFFLVHKSSGLGL